MHISCEISNEDMPGHENTHTISILNEFEIIIRKMDGYINATQFLAKYGGKKRRIKEWYRAKSTQKYLKNLNNVMPKNVIAPYDPRACNEIRGTYVHPCLLTAIANWVSTEFQAKCTLWIEKWKKQSELHQTTYYRSLAEINVDGNICTEKVIQTKLVEQFRNEGQHPKIEVETPNGKIDILTDDYIIEIKKYNGYKHALGQLLAYAQEYPNHKKIIYLFDKPHNKDLTAIKNLFDNFAIEVYLIE